MSISKDSGVTICREVFDENSQPSNEELHDYAKRLGIDPDTEPHLLDLAREGLMAALPEGWIPCFNDKCKAWYYYQKSTGTTSWQHPLDAVYKELVVQARAGGSRQQSLEDDSKTTAKDLDSQEDGTLSKDTVNKVLTSQTRIPMKLAPLKRLKVSLDTWNKEASHERQPPTWQSSDTRTDGAGSFSPLMVHRTARDYTNLRFQDPKFYESPRLLDPAKKELHVHMNEVLKRSESLSPRHEKDWEQLSSKFSSEENIIDIDRLSAVSLTKKDGAEGPSERESQKDRYSGRPSQQKELTLSGGGSIFLKSNRSRDTTPAYEGNKLADFQALATADEASTSAKDKLKSILREKPCNDVKRPIEDGKSVRFVLEKSANIKFTYSASEEEVESDNDDQNGAISATVTAKQAMTSFSFRRTLSGSSKDEVDKIGDEGVAALTVTSKLLNVVGKRFVVENVSEDEHLRQMEDKLNDEESNLPKKFEKVKNIDLVSKSDTSISTTQSSERSNFFDVVRKYKDPSKEIAHKSDELIQKSSTLDEKEGSPWASKILRGIGAMRMKNFETMPPEASKNQEKPIESLKDELDIALRENRKQLEENFLAQTKTLEANIEDRLRNFKCDLANKEEEEIQRLIAEMDEMRVENLRKVRNELEICYEKERQEILANLKVELNQRKSELLKLRNQEMAKLESEYEKTLDDEKQAKLCEFDIIKKHNEKVEALKKELDNEFDQVRNDLRMQQREKINKIKEDHEKCLAEVLRDFRIDEGLARKVYKQRLEEIRTDFSKDIENEVKKQNERAARQESVDFEKIRCEKRLLEDKYNTLKEKYLKLKKDLRSAVERRSKRKEANATASETEKSVSTRTRTECSEQKSSLKETRSHSNPNSSSKDVQGQNQSGAYDSEDQRKTGHEQRSSAAALSLSRMESDDTTTASETNSILLKKKKMFSKRVAELGKFNNNNGMENPVENIRKQLEKLEDLGDQLPNTEIAYTVRYPFQDKSPTNVSSELEFFRHRIHVERDSVRRAREALRQQRSVFHGRQRAWKQRSARATLEQLVKEERELSEMEVSLHRTRSLLGEKVIHLRHLEQSLDRMASVKQHESEVAGVRNDELTLSDMSSASSGFSSTDLGTDTYADKADQYQESTEIIASLENLNSEIREIWGVLNKRQDNNIPPPPTLMYSDLSWLPYQHVTSQHSTVPAFGTPNIQSNILSQLTTAHPPNTTTHNIIAQYGPNSGFTTSVGTVDRSASNLMERTRNLKDWLRQARVETSDLVSPGQATL